MNIFCSVRAPLTGCLFWRLSVSFYDFHAVLFLSTCLCFLSAMILVWCDGVCAAFIYFGFLFPLHSNLNEFVVRMTKSDVLFRFHVSVSLQLIWFTHNFWIMMNHAAGAKPNNGKTYKVHLSWRLLTLLNVAINYIQKICSFVWFSACSGLDNLFIFPKNAALRLRANWMCCQKCWSRMRKREEKKTE